MAHRDVDGSAGMGAQKIGTGDDGPGLIRIPTRPNRAAKYALDAGDAVLQRERAGDDAGGEDAFGDTADPGAVERG
ncbi:hypothetical protein, partial [Streptomyces zhihengii]|uniref:hypothetical protein n=1 Tax=Streptomyces zhihengii TaxID=1818004 RepID=UPI00361E0B0C